MTNSSPIQFTSLTDKSDLEAGSIFAPKFDDKGLITAVICDQATGTVLMVGHMNALALSKTLETGKAHYWSRSRQTLWLKGETSGNVQMVKEIKTDCDQDALVISVEVVGATATCHTGRQSCFYRTVEMEDGMPALKGDGSQPLFDPKSVYKS